MAIGASAGGVEAISDLLEALPAQNGMAFTLVLHRDPDHNSLLTELLTRKSRLPVVEIQDGMMIEAGRLHVVPADRAMTLEDGAFRLHQRDTAERRRMPIDLMFSSIAQQRDHISIAVVLSGTGSDGASGIREIKSAEGITFAQDPESARFGGMPGKAIETGCVDFVLPPKEIAREIEKISRHPFLRRETGQPQERPLSEDAGEAHEYADGDGSSLRKIFRLVRNRAHLDFSHYKRGTIMRRLTRRMAVRQIRGIAEYADSLRDDSGEIDALVEDFLISVTSFFRDPETFQGLAEIVFPSLLENRSQNDSIRIWAPGCATGEEVYSIAIALSEFLGERATAFPVQIFGTDLSEAAIQKARAGEYVDNVERDVSPERLRRFFIKLNEHYQVAKPIRDLCLFARHNVTYDPPFSRMDLICCRNVLIYFDSPLQRQVMQSFHYALKPGGFLILGASESFSQVPELFHLIDKRYRVYRKQDGALRMPGRVVHGEPAAALPVVREKMADEVKYLPEPAPGQREVERLLLARYAPACVLIDESLSVRYFQGETGRYLEHASGTASLSLQKLARPGLFMDISSAVHQARDDSAPVSREHVHIEAAGERREINIEVIPLRIPGSDTSFFVIIFQEVPAQARKPGFGRWFARWRTEIAGARSSETEHERRVRQLQHEVEATRDYLQTAIEEHEAAQEELKSAHEEALSANEEFQSTNEELETAKEELQSTNEELSTTNEELRGRNRELHELNDRLTASRDHLSAIYDTLREPVLVLDSSLRVLEANSSFYEQFQTPPAETENRLVYELGSGTFPLCAVCSMRC